MDYRQLGRTNVRVSLLGLGTGGVNRLGQSRDRSREDMRRYIRYALDQGINHIDTAPAYMESEALIGEALEGVPRDSYVLCTKVRGGPPGELRRSLENSLRKLRTDHVDVTYFHGVTPSQYRETVDKHLPELQQAQRDGSTRFLGVTELYERDPSHEMIKMLLADGLFDVFMIGHNMLTPSAIQHVFPEAQRKKVGIVVMCAVRSVISNPDALRQHIREWKDEGALPKDAVPDDKPLDWVLEPDTPAITDAAYKFAAEHPAVTSVLTGTADEGHLQANIRAILGAPLPRETSRRLADIFIPVNRSVQAGIGHPTNRR